MRYYLDTEFNGMGGELLSLALIREDGRALYVVNEEYDAASLDPWVKANVMPYMYAPTHLTDAEIAGTKLSAFAAYIYAQLKGDPDPVIVTDWPDDIKYFCQCLITGPGQMINIPGLKFEMHRVDAYPTTLEGAVQHNAYWDALALRHKLQEAQT